MSAKLTTAQDDVAMNGDLTRYRALLKIPGPVGAQPTVDAVLHSLATLLSNVVSFDNIALLTFDASGQRLALRAFERSRDDAAIEVGTEIMYAGTGPGRALNEQVPVFVPDIKQELAVYPELASRVSQAESAYIFPISTRRTKLGALVFARKERLEFSSADVELMRSIAGHLAVALENALAISSVEAYQRDLTRERDRLSLLLEINNHVVTILDINDLFRAASASIRKHFTNACNEILSRLHHVLPHLERSPLVIEKCESLLPADRTALLVPESYQMRKCNFSGHAFSVFLVDHWLEPPLVYPSSGHP